MGLIALFAGLAIFCALLWYCAIYALPVFVGSWVGWWALNHDAGAGCIVVGLVAGVALWLAGRLAATSSNPLFRWIGLAVFVIPAACVGFGIAHELVGSEALAWRDLLGVFGALGVGSVTYARLSAFEK